MSEEQKNSTEAVQKSEKDPMMNKSQKISRRRTEVMREVQEEQDSEEKQKKNTSQKRERKNRSQKSSRKRTEMTKAAEDKPK